LNADIAIQAQMKKATSDLVDQYGSLDVVVASAGINGVWAPIDDLTVEEWNRTISVNLTGTFLTIRAAVPHIKRAGGGRSSWYLR
jgi:NAD(P)-dependent dehydrogenase (short-subunit alcohol dehydrogenase family)